MTLEDADLASPRKVLAQEVRAGGRLDQPPAHPSQGVQGGGRRIQRDDEAKSLIDMEQGVLAEGPDVLVASSNVSETSNQLAGMILENLSSYAETASRIRGTFPDMGVVYLDSGQDGAPQWGYIPRRQWLRLIEGLQYRTGAGDGGRIAQHLVCLVVVK